MKENQIQITKKERQLFIFSACYLFISSIVLSLNNIFNINFEFNFFTELILSILRVTTLGILYLILFKYFKNYGLRLLRVLIIILLISYIYSQISFILNYNRTIIPSLFDFYLKIFLTIPEIIFVFILLKTHNNNYIGFNSLKKYSVTLIITLLIFFSFSIMEIYSKDLHLNYTYWKFLVLGIPYIFLIEFGIKLKESKPK